MLQPGDNAPEFSLPDSDMEVVKSSRLWTDRHLVLCFYPRDDTPSCSKEALEFSDLQPEFDACGANLAGISRDNCASHGAFRDKYGLSMVLLADTEGEVCAAYGVLREKLINGVMKQAVTRSTFVIEKGGRIRHIIQDVKPRGHAQEMLELVEALGR